ncbi:hypothetical protein ACLKA6_018244 [Drosophila palustris]
MAALDLDMDMDLNLDLDLDLSPLGVLSLAPLGIYTFDFAPAPHVVQMRPASVRAQSNLQMQLASSNAMRCDLATIRSHTTTKETTEQLRIDPASNIPFCDSFLEDHEGMEAMEAIEVASRLTIFKIHYN